MPIAPDDFKFLKEILGALLAFLGGIFIAGWRARGKYDELSGKYDDLQAAVKSNNIKQNTHLAMMRVRFENRIAGMEDAHRSCGATPHTLAVISQDLAVLTAVHAETQKDVAAVVADSADIKRDIAEIHKMIDRRHGESFPPPHGERRGVGF